MTEKGTNASENGKASGSESGDWTKGKTRRKWVAEVTIQWL